MYNIDEWIDKAGGFGKLQWIMIFYALFAFQGINFYIYNLSLLELVPRLEWIKTPGGDFVEWNKEDICNGDRLKDQ